MYNEKIFVTDSVTNVTDSVANVTDSVANVTDSVTDVTDSVADVTDEDADRAEKILDLIIENNKITASEIAKYMEVTKRTILRDIEKLKDKNLLERIGSEKGGYWKITKIYEDGRNTK